jgi:ABC-type Fe3+-hydroxamate transport system substrate-binding protein
MAVDLTLSSDSSLQYRGEDERRLAAGLTGDVLDFEKLKGAHPDTIIAVVRDPTPDAFIPWAQGYLSTMLGRTVTIIDVSTESLADVYRVAEEVGGVVGHAAEGRRLASRFKAQLMEWADSFFDRTRGRKVVILSGVTPLRVAARWFPDFAKLFSAQLFVRDPRIDATPLSWDEIVAFRPEVIVIAPEGSTMGEGIRHLPTLQGLPNWEGLPAVKRGDVIFADGVSLYDAGPGFLRGAAVVVSALASLESGYITKRDEYVKLRFVELHRHKFL